MWLATEASERAAPVLRASGLAVIARLAVPVLPQHMRPDLQRTIHPYIETELTTQ